MEGQFININPDFCLALLLTSKGLGNLYYSFLKLLQPYSILNAE